jgi:hypothetical protein
MLGYGEISTVQTPYQATRKSALHLAVFSLTLLCLAMLASRYSLLLPLLALFSPLGHELVIWLGMRTENRTPLYVPPHQGIMILDVLAGTPAGKYGLRSQDIILRINGQPVNRFNVIQELLQDGPPPRIMEIKRGTADLTLRVPVQPRQDLGIIPVPESYSAYYLSISEDGIFSIITRIWHRIKK